MVRVLDECAVPAGSDRDGRMGLLKIIQRIFDGANYAGANRAAFLTRYILRYGAMKLICMGIELRCDLAHFRPEMADPLEDPFQGRVDGANAG